MTEDQIIVAQLGGAFGVHGETRLKSFCAIPEDIASYGPFTLDTGATATTLVLTGKIKGGFSARLDTITTKEQADAHKGTKLSVPRSALPALPDDEYYYSDLIGLEALDTGGTPLGHVKALHDHGAGDLIELTLHNSGTTVILPFTRAIVPTIDLTAGRLIVDPPEDMLPQTD